MGHKRRQGNLINPSLLTLLQRGCSVEFPSGYKLRGDVGYGYISMSTEFGGDGVRILDADGLRKALMDERKYERENRE